MGTEMSAEDIGYNNDETFTFDEIFERYKGMVLSLAYNMTGSVQEAEDITQEVFINVYRGLSKFRGSSSIRTWIYRIALNETKAYYRKKRLKTFLSLWADDGSSIDIKDDRNPEAQFQDSEFMDHLKRALLKLSFKQRAVFVLKHMKGMKISEIARVLGCSEGTVKSHLFRAVTSLQESLKEAGYGM